MLKHTIFLMSFLMFSSALQAKVAVTYSAQQKPYFTMEVADSWQVNVGSDKDVAEVPAGEQAPPRVITVMPDDDSILWFGAWVPVYVHDLDAAQEYLSSLDDFLVDNPVLVKTNKVDLNTMPARYFIGKGEKEGNPVDFFVMLFELSKEHIGVAIYIGPTETTHAHLQELRSMMKSITPVRE